MQTVTDKRERRASLSACWSKAGWFRRDRADRCQAPLERERPRRRLDRLRGHSGSIHKVGAALQGAPSCNGWTFWHVERGRRAAAARRAAPAALALSSDPNRCRHARAPLTGRAGL